MDNFWNFWEKTIKKRSLVWLSSSKGNASHNPIIWESVLLEIPYRSIVPDSSFRTFLPSGNCSLRSSKSAWKWQKSNFWQGRKFVSRSKANQGVCFISASSKAIKVEISFGKCIEFQPEWKVSQELHRNFLPNWELWDNKSRNDTPLMISPAQWLSSHCRTVGDRKFEDSPDGFWLDLDHFHSFPVPKVCLSHCWIVASTFLFSSPIYVHFRLVRRRKHVNGTKKVTYLENSWSRNP